MNVVWVILIIVCVAAAIGVMGFFVIRGALRFPNNGNEFTTKRSPSSGKLYR